MDGFPTFWHLGCSLCRSSRKCQRAGMMPASNSHPANPTYLFGMQQSRSVGNLEDIAKDCQSGWKMGTLKYQYCCQPATGPLAEHALLCATCSDWSTADYVQCEMSIVKPQNKVYRMEAKFGSYRQLLLNSLYKRSRANMGHPYWNRMRQWPHFAFWWGKVTWKRKGGPK